MICETETLTHVQRRERPRAERFSLLDQMWVERGSREDWNLLHELHYKAQSLPSAPRFWRLTLEGRTIGVLVMTAPKGLLKERHIAFPHLKPGSDDTKITNTYRYVWINRNIRVISRFVIDTMFRGIGAGYRMMNLAARMEGFRFIEIQSSMSKFNLFGQKAGFRFVEPMNPHIFEAGLKFFARTFAANPGDIEEIMAEIEAMPPAVRAATIEECRRFYYRHSALEKTGKHRDGSGKARVERMNERTLIAALQQLCLASPMYGVWENPDLKPNANTGLEKMPERMPLSAFEMQGPREPLKWRP